MSSLYDVEHALKESMAKSKELNRINKLLKEKRRNLIVMNEYLHQGDDDNDENNSIKTQLQWAQEQYNQRIKRVQDDIEKVETAIAQQNKKYDLLIENKRNLPIAERQVTEAEITAFADTLNTYINA
jgi:3-phosphoglycerate kinase